MAGGLGLAVLSATTVVSELALGELVQLDVQGFPLIRQWHVVYPRGKRLSPAALAFKDWLYTHRPVPPQPAGSTRGNPPVPPLHRCPDHRRRRRPSTR